MPKRRNRKTRLYQTVRAKPDFAIGIKTRYLGGTGQHPVGYGHLVKVFPLCRGNIEYEKLFHFQCTL